MRKTRTSFTEKRSPFSQFIFLQEKMRFSNVKIHKTSAYQRLLFDYIKRQRMPQQQPRIK